MSTSLNQERGHDRELMERPATHGPTSHFIKPREVGDKMYREFVVRGEEIMFDWTRKQSGGA
jgi:hypothetical protein